MVSVTALGLLLVGALQKSDFREVASLVTVHSADRIVVKFRNFRDFEDGRWVTRDVTLIGLRAPATSEPGYKESLAWAKARYKVGDLVSGRYYPTGKGTYLGDIFIKGTSATTDVLEGGMAKIDEKRVPASTKRSAGYEMIKGTWLRCQASAKKMRSGLWGTVWTKENRPDTMD